MSFKCTCMPLVCHPCVTHRSFVCQSYVRRMPSVCTRMSYGCSLYVLVCHPYVTPIYSYVTRMSLLCACMSPVCHSMCLYVTRMSLLCTRISPVCYLSVVLPWTFVNHWSNSTFISIFSWIFSNIKWFLT